ncbi:hypothetical protein P7K49_001038 [Saguinus oedipus]|uniref:Uncharacterized protein n=1 Tax=Saguinus oedipus TaxID=9490 RepID=A0ABQ9WDD2_SAGOE|nr:hypothetical protein P7K49_001038 [Saguinus oedipus]
MKTMRAAAQVVKNIESFPALSQEENELLFRRPSLHHIALESQHSDHKGRVIVCSQCAGTLTLWNCTKPLTVKESGSRVPGGVHQSLCDD